MKETGSVEPMGSQLGLPGEEKSIERTKYSHMPHRGAVYHFESVFVSFSFGKGIFLLSSVPWVASLLQLGHTVMHTCTSTHKHNEICTWFLPRYIIISTKLYRLSGVLDWRVYGHLKTTGGQFTVFCWGQRCHIYTTECNSAVLSLVSFITVWSVDATVINSKKRLPEPDKY